MVSAIAHSQHYWYTQLGVRPFYWEHDWDEVMKIGFEEFKAADQGSLEEFREHYGQGKERLEGYVVEEERAIKGFYLFRKVGEKPYLHNRFDNYPEVEKKLHNFFSAHHLPFPRTSDLEEVMTASAPRSRVVLGLLTQCVLEYAGERNSMVTTTCWTGDNKFLYNLNEALGFRAIGVWKDYVLMAKEPISYRSLL